MAFLFKEGTRMKCRECTFMSDFGNGAIQMHES